MLYAIKNRDDLENLNELISLQRQIEAIRLKDKLGKRNFQDDMKKVYETGTKSIQDVSEEVTKDMTETSIKNNKALENLNHKFLELMKNRGLLAPYLLSPLSKINNPEHIS